jgi:hypothetical protein
MSGQPVRTQADISKFRQQYLDTLQLQADINEMNYQANKIYIKTGAPSQPTDTRTADEKLQDIYRLRSDVRTLLREIMTGEDANIVAERLNENEIRFLAQQANIIFPELKKSYRLGITSDLFFQYFREYMRKFQETSGVAIEEMRQFVKDHLPTKQQLQEFRQVVNNIMDLHNQIQQINRGEYLDLGNYAELFIDRLNGLEEIINDINKSIIDATRIKNAIIRNEVLKSINAIVREVPTKQQISVIIKNLNIGYDRADPDFIINIFADALEVIEFSDDVREDLQLLNENLEREDIARVPIPQQNFPERPRPRDIIPPREQQPEGMEFENLYLGERPMFENPMFAKPARELRKEFLESQRQKQQSIRTEDERLALEALLGMRQQQPFQEERQFTQEELEAMNEPYKTPVVQGQIVYDEYIPVERLQDVKIKTSRIGNQIALLDYLDAMKKIDPDEVNSWSLTSIGSTSIKTLNKKYTREQIYRILKLNDERIQNFWRNQPRPQKEGKGVLTNSVKTSRIRGRGLKTTKPVDFTAGIMSEPDYVPFGKYIINRKRLGDGVCMIKRINGKFMPDMKTKRISPSLTAVFRKVAGGSLPNFSELEKLDDDEREYLKHISKKCNLSSRLEVPSPKKDKTETLVNQFEIMRGQLIAGNDSKDLIKNFKKILIEMLEKDLLPKGQAKDILIDLARME